MGRWAPNSGKIKECNLNIDGEPVIGIDDGVISSEETYSYVAIGDFLLLEGNDIYKILSAEDFWSDYEIY